MVAAVFNNKLNQSINQSIAYLTFAVEFCKSSNNRVQRRVTFFSFFSAKLARFCVSLVAL
jgi:hypothetical protein